MRFVFLILAGFLMPALGAAAETVMATSSKATRETDPILAEQPVNQRIQPGFDIPGIHLGNLLIHPSMQLLEVFDTNVYATKNNHKSDLVSIVSPGLTVQTLQPRYGAKLIALSHHGFYADNSSENYNDTRISLDPYYRMMHASVFKGRLLLDHSHELRSSEAANTNFGAEEPVRFTQSLGRLWWEYKPSHFAFTPYVEHAVLAYNNVGRRSGGPAFINNDRDRSEDEIGAKLAYELFGKNQLYLQNRGFSRDYKRADYNNTTFSYSGASRDSKGWETRAGTTYFLTPLTNLDLNVGAYHQSFQDSFFKDANVAVARAVMTWQTTALTTCSFGVERQVLETTQDDASAFIQNGFDAKVFHELRRHIILGAQANIGSNDYIGNDRRDDYWAAGFSGLYRLSRSLGLKADYAFENRNSTLAAADYSKHQVFVSLQVEF